MGCCPSKLSAYDDGFDSAPPPPKYDAAAGAHGSLRGRQEPFDMTSVSAGSLAHHISPYPQGRAEIYAADNPTISRQGQGELLVISMDIGTTASGVAYMHRDASGKILGPDIIDDWPGTARGRGKTPSVLLYDRAGKVREWGGACLAPGYGRARLEREGLIKTEWFKLHILPGETPVEHLEHPDHQLPPGMSAFQVFTDFLGLLHRATLERIISKRGRDFLDPLLREGKVLYVLTIPVAWRTPEVLKGLRQAAFDARLISSLDSESLDFATEPEASALHCYSSMADVRPIQPGEIFTVVDAGGGTVDLTSYKVTTISPSLTMQEVDVGAKRCLFRGSTFIDQSFQTVLRNHLDANYPSDYDEENFNQGCNEFRDTIKVNFTPEQKNQYLRIGRDSEFQDGVIELSWTEVESAFRSHVDAIVESAKKQVFSPQGMAKYIFLAGGLGSNAYLRARLQAALPNVQCLQPDDLGGTKAVALGACRYAMFKPVKSRISPGWYGIRSRRDVTEADRAHPDLARHMGVGRLGEAVVNGSFAPIMSYAEEITDQDWSAADFSLVLDKERLISNVASIEFYECRDPLRPVFVDGANVRKLCTVEVTVPTGARFTWKEDKDGNSCKAYDVQVQLQLGQAEMKARAKISGELVGSAKIVIPS